MKPSVKNYLNITKTEWNGLVVLVLLIIGVLAMPYIYRHLHKDKQFDFKKLNIAVARFKQAGVTGYNIKQEGLPAKGKDSNRLFGFNPNHLPVSRWQKLGLTAQQIQGIKNYEAKGGRFYSKADVKKMYTLTVQDYNRLAPYIQLPVAGEAALSKLLIIELNTADSATLTRLKGIGPTYARRIINYRKNLGGFHHKQQLKEVFGMDDMRYQDIEAQIKVNKRKIVQFNINRVELDDLKNFPYLNYKQANAIIQYRKQHGDYETFEELQNIVILNSTVLQKIRPYIITGK